MSTLYVLKEGHRWGPFTTEEVEERVERGVFAPDDLLWAEGMEEWQPIATIIEAVPEAEELPEETLYEGDDILVTTREVRLADHVLPVGQINRASPQKEAVRRLRPTVVGIALGVVIVCLVLVELPRTTPTHWAIWAAVTLALFVWWLRTMYAALRSPRCHVTIDLHNGDERLIHATPDSVDAIAEAINLAVKQGAGADSAPGPLSP